MRRAASIRLCHRLVAAAVGQRMPELAAGGDIELGEDLAQVVFDGARGQELLGGGGAAAPPTLGPGGAQLVFQQHHDNAVLRRHADRVRERITRFGVGTILKRNVTAAATTLASLAAKSVSPHVLRHTTALHLLQSGVELNVIKSWLGHVSITTTSEYIEIDMAMKAKRSNAAHLPLPGPEGESRWHTPAKTSSNGSKTSESPKVMLKSSVQSAILLTPADPDSQTP
jgi:hypothetical protein